ncbi:hypothetical protein S83_025278 [Arachis hypogaea]
MMMMMMDNEKNHDGVFVPSSHTVAEHVTMNEDDETSENLELPLDNKKKSLEIHQRKDNAVGNKKKQKVESNGKEIEESNDNYTALEDDNGTNNYNKEENSGGATSSVLNSNGKTRVTRGSATDPQSLYARRRRERINERLRTLQSLVPNGTKVDISTMLEEAVHYVKFLQLQIKLLSSDDLWMYAPIAYNGFDIGLINLSPQQH